MSAEGNNTAYTHDQLGVIGAFVAVWLLPAVALTIPEGRIWGIGFLQFLPLWFRIGYFAAGAVLLALFFKPLQGLAAEMFETAGRSLFNRPSIVKWSICSLAALFIFWLFRVPVVLLGDGQSVAGNIGSDVVLFKWTERGATYVAYLVSRLLPYSGVELGQSAYRIVSVLAGGATIFLFLAIAFELGREYAERLFLFIILVFGGWLLLFFGYVENYPILWPFIAAYILSAIRFLNNKGSLVPAILLLLVAIGLHIQMLFFAISLLPLLTARGWTGNFYRTHRTMVNIVLGLIIAAGGGLFVWLYHVSIPFYLIFIPFAQGRAPNLHYTLFSPAHLMDIVNLLLMVTPLLPVLAIAAIRSKTITTLDTIDRFLLAFSVGGLAFLILIEPRLGMGRDWDLFALTGMGPLLICARRATRSGITRLYPVLSVAAMVLLLPFLAVNLTFQPSLDRYKALLRLDITRSRTGLIILRDIYKQARDTAAADSLEQVLKAHFPAYARVPEGYRMIEKRQFGPALALADSLLALDPYSAELYLLRSTVYLRQGSNQLAVDDAEKAFRLGNDDYRVLLALAAAYQAIGRYAEMKQKFQQARERNPNALLALEAYASEYITERRFDSAYLYGKKMIQLDSTYANGYVAAGYAAYMLGDSSTARNYLRRCLDLNPGEPTKTTALKILDRLP